MIFARRRLLHLGAASAVLYAEPIRAEAPVTIRMRSDADGGHVGFDPVGLLIEPGRTVSFVCEANYHTAEAYHPANTGHSLRIPRAARPWASDVLQPGEKFDVLLTVPGVYDYFCAPHEAGGMVGRLIVGHPGGPGSEPFDWFKGRPEGREWLPVPAPARAVFPSVADIMRRRSVPAELGGTTHQGHALLLPHPQQDIT